MVQDAVKSYVRAPEGRYQLHSEKSHSCSFNSQRMTRLTFATIEMQAGTPSRYVIYNSSDALGIANYAFIEKPPNRQILVAGSSSHSGVYPTCHDYAPNVKGYDLVVGLSSGDVVLGTLRAQLNAGNNNLKLLEMLHFNKGGHVDASRAVDVAFMPGTHGGYIVVAHESGNVYMYCTSAGTASDGTVNTKGSSPSSALKPTTTIRVCQKELKSAAVSPDGSKIACATKDGVLYVHDLTNGQLVGGFKSFCGGLLCCAWSFDSQYIAAGGEDDMICVYGLTEQAQVFWGEGHTSWVTRIGFDRWESEIGNSEDHGLSSSTQPHLSGPERTRYRIVSVGQDCQILFWDFVVEDGEYLAEESEARSPMAMESFSRIHKRTPSSSAVQHLGLDGDGLQSLPAKIQPASKQSQMIISSPVASQMIHHDPCSDLLFMKDALYTASQCCEIKCWIRPRPQDSQGQSQAQQSPSSTPKE